MLNVSKQNVKLCKKIYNYITPIIIINEEWMEYIKENQNIKVFMLIASMRNTACHHILKGNLIQPLFVNIIKLYQVFELHLLKIKEIRILWEEIPAKLKKFRLCTKKGAFINDEEIDKVRDNNFHEFYNYFQKLLHFINNSRNRFQMFKEFGKSGKTKIKLIYKYVAPIFMWYQNVVDQFKKEYSNDLLFKICYYTRTCVCHFSEMVVDESFLIQLIKNITITYVAFGLDINSSVKNVNKLLVEQSFLCKYYVNVNENIEFDDETKFLIKDGNEIISEIRSILCNKENKELNEKYFLFGQMLHYFVATKISKGDMITQVLLDKENNIEWCRIENRLIIKDLRINSSKRSILKFSGPLFVWFESVSNLMEFNQNQFYLSVGEVKQRIINYLIVNEDNGYEENYILQRMESIYEPIINYFNNNNKDLCSNNLENIQFYDLFVKLVNHSVIGRIKKQFSLSFIFKYFYKRKNISNEMENKAKMFDIFNFCGVFYIYVSCFENNLKVCNNCFYGKVKIITDEINQYMINEIRITIERNEHLQNEIIKHMKSVFSEFSEISTSDYDSYEIFSQLYSNIVTSRSNVEISNSNLNDEVREIGNKTKNLNT